MNTLLKIDYGRYIMCYDYAFNRIVLCNKKYRQTIEIMKTNSI